MNERDQGLSYADRVLRDAMVSVSGGFDAEVVSAGIADMVQAFRKVAAELSARPFESGTGRGRCGCGAWVTVEVPITPEGLARAAAHIAKATDEMSRLGKFLAGQPDSRPGDARGAGRDVLRLLTDEQLGVVQGWLAEAERRGERTP